MKDVINALHEQLEGDVPCATATILAVSGSIPNEVGAKMLVSAAGELIAGTIGGGAFEHQALQEAARAILAGQSRVFKWSLTEKAAGGIGMLCGGTAEVFIEVFVPGALLVLVGGGHVNRQLWKLARDLGYRGIVVDERTEWANPEHFPACEILPEYDPAAAFSRIAWIENSYVVIGTRDQDTAALRAAAVQRIPSRFIGMIASRRKALRILENLEAEGVALGEVLPRFRGPAGLDLGKTKSPQAVALSIMAEIQALRFGGSGRPLDVANRRDEVRSGRQPGKAPAAK
ncbi:MAG: XdhC family protein [Candidatus Sericytochromatia bacterium]|nr:XdhC family protein [Candidatus Tanganyikabacteria bacterium]